MKNAIKKTVAVTAAPARVSTNASSPKALAEARVFSGHALWHSCAHCSSRCGGDHGPSHIVAGVVLCPDCYTPPARGRGEMPLVDFTP